jgi:hypothetical protein
MKKLLLAAVGFLAITTARAQIENGSVAPDFTATDVFGVPHTLSDYLAEGKTVIMDISATWCQPCWDYHHSGALERLYYSLGQGGTGEVVVLLIEGDSNTAVDCLFGICPDNSTHGNWVKHSPYPVIDSASIAQLYDINYFPTIFRICPDGIVTTIDQLQAEALIENISLSCGTSAGIQKNARPDMDNIMLCEAEAVSPAVAITNYGSEAINTATVKLLQGDTVLATKDFTGTINPFNGDSIIFDPIQISPGEDYTVKITHINGSAPENDATVTNHFTVKQATTAHNNITVKVHTDLFPNEISWAIKSSEGTTVASGGPYGEEVGIDNPNSNSTLIHNITLPGSNADCYSVELYDSYGDGWNRGDTGEGIEIWSAGEKIFEQSGDDFGHQLIALPAFKANGTLDSPAMETIPFTLFPNPTTGIITFTGIEQAEIFIYDTLGKIVYPATKIENGTVINLSSLQKGLYVACIRKDNATVIQKIILN